MSRTKRLHVDCSSLGGRSLELAVSIFGADRIVMGTDCPIFSTDWTLAAIRDARIDDTDRHAILYGNAERLLEL
jgi:predicted TIM-barrel fold metal-dependent hydrolase